VPTSSMMYGDRQFTVSIQAFISRSASDALTTLYKFTYVHISYQDIMFLFSYAVDHQWKIEVRIRHSLTRQKVSTIFASVLQETTKSRDLLSVSLVADFHFKLSHIKYLPSY